MSFFDAIGSLLDVRKIMANPKTILNKSKCSKTIQKSIYKYDQVITFLKGLQDDKTNDKNMLEKYMYRISDYLLMNNKPLKMDHIAKYGLVDDDFSVGELARVDSIKEIAAGYSGPGETVETINMTENNRANTNVPVPNRNNDALIVALKKYRLKVSKEEGLKPYHVFSDKELEDLINTMPKNRKELMGVKGFAEKKVTKYGDEIIRILKG